VFQGTKSSLALWKNPGLPQSNLLPLLPAFVACQGIPDVEADNMELKEENKSVALTTDPTVLRGDPLSPHPPSPMVHKKFNGTIMIWNNPYAVCQSTTLDDSVNPCGNSSEKASGPDLLPFDLDNDQESTNPSYSNDDATTSSLDATAELMQWHL
jgi:hypothetical protein